MHIIIKCGRAYEFHSATGSFNDEVGHVANQVSGQAKVEEHVEDIEDHLDGVDSVEVAVANCGHGGGGPVEGRDVADPEAGLPEVRIHGAEPCLALVRVSVGQQVVEAAGTVH